MSVNKPTDVKVKEQDINQKLQLYGIYSAFAKGKAPSNKQVDVAMNSALASRPLANPSKKLSPEGQLLVGDLRDVIEKAKILLLTKNENNLIQDFIWQSQGATTGDAQKPNIPVDKETAKQHGNEALEGLRTLGTLLLSNGQFRKLLNDAVILLRDIAGDGAQKAANKVNPSEDQLNQIDEPAEDNTWHEAPDLSGGNIKAQMKAQYEKNKPFNKESQTAEDGSTDAKAEAKSQANEAAKKTKEYLGEKMPKERRDQTVWRLKKMVVEIQGHQDYQRAIDTLLQLAETYQGYGKSIGGDSAAASKDLKKAGDPLLNDLRTLIERFANSTSLEDFFEAINNFYRDADADPELKQFFKDLDTYIRKCLKEQGYIMQDAATEEWDRLREKGRFLLRERYRNHTDRLIEEVKFIGRQFDEDPQNKAFANSMNKLFTDLGNDENGKPTFKTHLVKDLSEIIIPAIFENIRYVPIPRIEYTDKMADLIVENLVIEGDNLAPNVFEFGSDNYFRWGRKKIANQNKNKVMVSVSGIQMDIRDVSYYVKKKEGFPAITDTGVMDIFLGGTGLSFKIAMETADKSDKNHFFKVNNVKVDIKHMDIKLKQSKHKLLFGIFKPLLFKVMNPVIQKVVEKQLQENVRQLDAFCYEIHQDAKRAEIEAKNDPEQAPNIYKRYYDAWQRKMTIRKEEAKKKAAEKVEDKKVNIAMTQYDSMFKDISLPGGISSKATEYKDLAAKGDKWESPVFSIGKAPESTSLPKAAPIQRKSHSTTPGVIKDPSTSYAQTNGTSEFNSQVTNAFGKEGVSTDLQPNNTTGTTLGSMS